MPLAVLWAALEGAVGQGRCWEKHGTAGSIPVASGPQAVPPSNPYLPPSRAGAVLWIHGAGRGQLQGQRKGRSCSKVSTRDLAQGPEGHEGYL